MAKKIDFLNKYYWTIASGITFVILAILVKVSKPVIDLNKKIFSLIYGFDFPVNFWEFFSSLADTITLIGLVLIIFLILFFKKKRDVSFTFVSMNLIAYLIETAAKLIISLPRPDLPLAECGHINLTSFPSGHTFAIFFFFGSLYLIFNEKKNLMVFFALFFGIMVGLARISLGCHWPFDIVGSFVLGFCLLSFFGIHMKNGKIFNIK